MEESTTHMQLLQILKATKRSMPWIDTYVLLRDGRLSSSTLQRRPGLLQPLHMKQ